MVQFDIAFIIVSDSVNQIGLLEFDRGCMMCQVCVSSFMCFLYLSSTLRQT